MLDLDIVSPITGIDLSQEILTALKFFLERSRKNRFCQDFGLVYAPAKPKSRPTTRAKFLLKKTLKTYEKASID